MVEKGFFCHIEDDKMYSLWKDLYTQRLEFRNLPRVAFKN